MNQKKNAKQAALAGAAVGTAIGVGIGAAAVVLSDKKNRDILVKKTKEFTKDAEKTLKQGKQEMTKMKASLEKKVENTLPAQEVQQTLKKAAPTTKKTVKKTTKNK